MRLPTQPGLWPAFWMMGEDLGRVGWPRSGEIDVMELVGDEPGKVWASAHGPGYIRAGLTAPFDLPHGQTFSDEFHTFGVELSGDELAFDVDGTVYHRVHRRDIGADKVWVFDKPFHVILNLAVGGEWPGSPSASTQLPARLVIDHVAIYR